MRTIDYIVWPCFRQYCNVIFFLIMGMIRYEDVIPIQTISYEPLWQTMKRKKITQYQLIKDYNFSHGTLDKLRKNQSLNLTTIHDICQMLNCRIEEVVDFPDITADE